MSQLLAAAGPYTLTKTWYVDGTATDVGTVTIGIVDGNGDEVVAAATATTNNADGTYTYSLADQANPDLLKATWTRSDTGADLVDRLELVGNQLFTEAQARSFAAKSDATAAHKPLNSATEYPDAILAAERQRISEDLEYWTGRSWIPRYCRAAFKGSGGSILDLTKGQPRTSDGYRLHRPGRLTDIAVLLSITIDGNAATVTDFDIDGEHLIRTDGGNITAPTTADPLNVSAEWVYGLPQLVDGVDRIALKELIVRLVPSAFPEDFISADTEYGSIRRVLPGGPMRNVSRSSDVNAWVQAHDHRIFI